MLSDVHKINPYKNVASVEELNNRFSYINVASSVLAARGDKATLESERFKYIRLSELSGTFSTYTTGGKMTTTPKKRPDNPETYPSYRGFDNMESYYIGVSSNPSENVEANVTVNVLGNVAENPIDEVFFENRGRRKTIIDENGNATEISDINRVMIYNADFRWDANLFETYAFYRKGHYHWGYEGDFFGLYPEANYGPNIDIYNGAAPFGAEFTGKKGLSGLKVAFGPELWWGANPAFLVKYGRKIGNYQVTGIFHHDIAQRDDATSSFAIPQPKNTRATVMVKRNIGAFTVELGGIWSGSPLVGREYQVALGEPGNWSVYEDKVRDTDAFGGKGKITYKIGRAHV